MINSPPLPVSVMTTAIKWSGDPVKVELPPTDIPPKVYEAACGQDRRHWPYQRTCTELPWV